MFEVVWLDRLLWSTFFLEGSERYVDGGEYCFTLFFRVARWRQATSSSQFLVLKVLVMRDVRVP